MKKALFRKTLLMYVESLLKTTTLALLQLTPSLLKNYVSQAPKTWPSLPVAYPRRKWRDQMRRRSWSCQLPNPAKITGKFSVNKIKDHFRASLAPNMGLRILNPK